MLFGLASAPATFELMIENILRHLLRKRCLVYLDNLIIFGMFSIDYVNLGYRIQTDAAKQEQLNNDQLQKQKLKIKVF